MKLNFLFRFPIHLKRGQIYLTEYRMRSRRGHAEVKLGCHWLSGFIFLLTLNSEFLIDDQKIQIIYLSGPFSRSASVDLGIKSAEDGPLLITDVDMVFNEGGFQNWLFKRLWLAVKRY